MTTMSQYAEPHGRCESEIFMADHNHQARLSRMIVPGQPVSDLFQVAVREYSFGPRPHPKFEETAQTVDEVTYRCLCAAKKIACQGRLRNGGYTLEQSLPLIEKAKEATAVVEGYVNVVDIFLLMLQGIGLFKHPDIAYSRGYGKVTDSNRLGVCFLPKS